MTLPLTWRSREPPLAPVGVVARGAAARAMAERLLARSDEALALLRGLAGSDVLLLLGGADDLPWVEGAAYLGRDVRAPSLLIPTLLEPAVPPALLEQAVLRAGGGPWAVLVDPPRRMNLNAARPLDRHALGAWARALP